MSLLNQNQDKHKSVEVKPEPKETNQEMPSLEMTEEQLEEERKQMMALINNPAVKQNGLTVARDFRDTFHRNWFTIAQVQKKSAFKTFEQAYDILNILCLLGMAFRKVEDKGLIKYKITLGHPERIKLFEEEILNSEKHIEYCKAEITRLQEDIVKGNI